MKVLQDVEVTFDPKDRAHDLLRFWKADICFEKDIISQENFELNDKGEFVINLQLRIKPDTTKPNDVAFGVLGQWPL